MGLDVIELALEIEEEFSIRIPDRDAEHIRTVGDLVDYAHERLRKRSHAVCPTSHTFFRLRRELMHHLALPRPAVRPTASMAALVPEVRRREVWRELEAAGLPLPPLQGGVPACCVWMTAALVLGAAAFLWWSGALVLLAALGLVLLAARATQPLAVAIPPACVTVRATVFYLTPGRLTDALSREEIASRVRRIVAENLGLSLDEVQEHSRIAEDLGAG
jgi:acyl carrier protein